MEPGNVEIFVSNEKDPTFNLALEEYLFYKSATSGDRILFYINDSSVIMGKHQNPFQECSLSYLNKNGIELLRRFSGGGAVYHDPGNVNFSFMTWLQRYKPEVNIKYICDALKARGFAVEKGEKNDLLIGGRKISGSAFAIKRQRALHHGTLLVSADLKKMNLALLPSFDNINGMGTKSRPAEVMNLSETEAGFSSHYVLNYLAQYFATLFASGKIMNLSKKDMDNQNFASILNRHRSWSWKFAQTPPFELSAGAHKFAGTIDLMIKNGLIEYISAPDNTGLISFIGKRFSTQIMDEMQNVLKETKNGVELEVY